MTLHLRDDIDRLYVSRETGGRGLACIEDSVDPSIRRLEDYIQKHGKRLITATRNNTDKINRKQKFEEKLICWCFKRLTGNVSHEKKMAVTKKGKP